MPLPSITIEIQWPFDVCAHCGQERQAHGRYNDETSGACGWFRAKETAPIADEEKGGRDG
jgi:hypothetical protein